MSDNYLSYSFLLIVPLLINLYLFRKNRIDAELSKTALLGLIFGVLSVFVVKVIYFVIEQFIQADLRSFLLQSSDWRITLLITIGVVGFIEEFIKALAALLVSYLVSYNRRPPVVFMSFIWVAVGFSLIENISYYSIYGFEVLLPRIVVSSSAHLFFSALSASIVGVAFSRPKSESIISIRVAAGILAAALAHGTFDFLMFTADYQALSGLLITIAYVFGLGIYEAWVYVLKNDLPEEHAMMLCSSCTILLIGRARFCTRCGRRLSSIHPEQLLPRIN